MLDFLDEFLRAPFFQNEQFPGVDRNIQPAGGEGADEDHLLGVLRDVDEAAGAGEARAELGDVEVALLVGLGEAEEGDVQPAALVEVELAGLVDDSLGVGRRAKAHAAGRHAADDAGFGGERHQVDDLFLGGDVGDAFRHANAEVDHRIGGQLEGRTAGDDLALAHRHRCDRRHRHLDLACEGGAVGLAEGLHVVFGLLGDDHAVDEDAGNLDLPRVERAALGDALDLDDDRAAGVVRRHGDGLRFQGQRLALHGDVAVGIGGGAADNADVDREGLVEQVFLAIDLHQADDVPGRLLVQLAAAEAGVDEGPEADPGDGARPAGGDVAEHVGDDALWQVPGFDAVGHGKLLQFGDQSPVAADDATDEAVMAEVVEPPLLAVTLAGGIEEAEVARATEAVRVFLLAFEEEFLEGDGDVLGEADADEAAGGDRVTVADQAHRLAGRNYLAGVGGAQRGGHGVTG